MSYRFEHSRSEPRQYLALGKSGQNHFAHFADVDELCACTRWCRWWRERHFVGHMVWVCMFRKHSTHVQFGTCELKFVIRCCHMCGKTRVDIFVSAVELHVWE